LRPIDIGIVIEIEGCPGTVLRTDTDLDSEYLKIGDWT